MEEALIVVLDKVRCAVSCAWLGLAALILVTAPPVLNASCGGTVGVTPEQVSALQSLLPDVGSGAEFLLYAEVDSSDGNSRFFLYSIIKHSDPHELGVYLGAATKDASKRLLFIHDVSAYLPVFAHESSHARKKSAQHGSSELEPVSIDGCLNSSVLQPNLQAIHVNLFAKSPRARLEEANDVVFALAEPARPQPVLELTQTSRSEIPAPHRRIHRDSVIAVVPSASAASDIIWQHFAQDTGGIMVPSFIQNKVYRWDGKGFRKAGSLTPAELAERLKTAFVLPRSAEISSLRLEDKMPGANQPPP